MKENSAWYSPRLEQDMRLVRWGHYGAPVLLFPTAGGDAEEAERFQLVASIWPLIEQGRIKVYACDSVAGQAWIRDGTPPVFRARLQNLFDGFVYREALPAIRMD